MKTTPSKTNVLRNFFASPHVGIKDARNHIQELWANAEEMPEGGIEGRDRSGKPTGLVFHDPKLRKFTAGEKEIILGPF